MYPTAPGAEPTALPNPPELDGFSYLYGHPLLNSLSPLLHKTLYDALGLNWTQFPLSVSDTSNPDVFPPPYTLSLPIAEFFAQTKANERFIGSSVTMPWKVAILPHLDELAEEAKGAGACNTIFIREEEGGITNGNSANGNTARRVFVGTNTDCIGIREALLQNLPSGSRDTLGSSPLKGKPALIIGGGGTARAAIYALRKWIGASKIYIVNRDRAEVETVMAEDAAKPDSIFASEHAFTSRAELIHVVDPAEVKGLNAPYTIVSGVPNYPPKTPEEITARRTIEALLQLGEEEKGVLLEMCYHPKPWTDIAELASSSGWKVVLGTEAMIWQGIEQVKLWTGRDIVKEPGVVEKVKAVIERALAERVAGK
ncbi:hypothetical protein AJ79_06882 [Helicocarpus griseus UAMH5409]|uniref:Shikimate dehydrogenase substrate binding N-terminal domain-containing protein n=1 Tax=Helicocarpus griseus UAMH5409 TaxID=1447875 RepID=A0A2B7X0J9_9EURO|nr:hypothetical protein AJ79_06882 [Helicocarpus griseus UAMH5409]